MTTDDMMTQGPKASAAVAIPDVYRNYSCFIIGKVYIFKFLTSNMDAIA